MGVTDDIIYYRQGKEYFFSTDKILFFEADDRATYAHTRNHIYRVKRRLYVLEAVLPQNFIRVSRSGIVNVNHVLSFATTVGTTGTVEFADTDKRLHVSRQYIKSLRSALRNRSKQL